MWRLFRRFAQLFTEKGKENAHFHDCIKVPIRFSPNVLKEDVKYGFPAAFETVRLDIPASCLGDSRHRVGRP
jgi:hypothetical protein